MIIRPARMSDASVLADFNIRLAHETEHLSLDPATVLSGVQAALEDPSKGLYFVADASDSVDPAKTDVVGCTMVTHEWSDWRNGDIWWIQSVYVREDHRRKGVFSALYQKVMSEAKSAGVVAVRLYVEKHNAAAQQTYTKLGMGFTEYLVMEQSIDGLSPGKG